MSAHDGLPPASTRRRHRPRVIPVLLLKGELLYKTVRFRDAKYVGDPRIAVKIFNDKGADELVLLDILSTPERTKPKFKLIEEIAGEAFMPVAYGGGIRDLNDINTILGLGIEKIIINTHAVENPHFVAEAATQHGSSTVVVSIDSKRDFFRRPLVYTHGGRKRTRLSPMQHARHMVDMGAGEIFVNSIDRDGTFSGYDLDLVKGVVDAVKVPVIACGGAGKLEELGAVVRETGASAAAAGSLFVFQLPHRAVLVTFPSDEKLSELFGSAPKVLPNAHT